MTTGLHIRFVVCRAKVPFLSGCESRPATVAPAGSSRSGRWRQRHRLKHSDDNGPPLGGSATMRAATRVSAEQASERRMRKPTRPQYGEGPHGPGSQRRWHRPVRSVVPGYWRRYTCGLSRRSGGGGAVRLGPPRSAPRPTRPGRSLPDWCGEVRAGTVDGFGHVAQMPLGMVDVDGRALDRSVVADRPAVPDGQALPVARFRGSHRNQLDLAGLGRTVGMLAAPPGRLGLAHRHPAAVQPEVHRRRRGGGGFDHPRS